MGKEILCLMIRNTALTKEMIQQRLSGNDLKCHYYESIMNATTDMIALTDSDRIIDANLAMKQRGEKLGKDIFSPPL